MNDFSTPTTRIAVLDRGFVYVGTCVLADGMLTITGARNIRRWGTAGEGLGLLAEKGPQPATKLDRVGTVRAPVAAVMHLIDCDPAAWPTAAA